MGALVVFFTLSLPALACCRWPLPRKPRPREADVAVCVAYLFSIFAAAFEVKRKWQLKFKPGELLPAGAFGTLAAFGFAVVLLPLDRTHVLFKLTAVPFERAVKFHRWAGRVAVFLVVIHGIAEALVLGMREMVTFEQEAWGFGNAFGTLAGLSAVALAAAGVSRFRRANYEVFINVHRVFAGLIYIGGSLHCFAFATMSVVCLLLHAAGWLARYARRSRSCGVLRAEKFGSAEVDGEAVLLNIEWSADGVASTQSSSGKSVRRLAPGAWFLLQVPGDRGWHPYSVAAEGEGTVSFLVKNMGEGSWSAQVTTNPPATLRIEGPYGGPGFAPRECTALMLVGGGVGLTPLARLWCHPPAGISHVELIWVVRTPEAVSWLAALLPELSSAAHRGSIRIFVTRQGERERLPSLTWAAGVSPRDQVSQGSQVVEGGIEGLGTSSHHGSITAATRPEHQSFASDGSSISSEDVEWSRQCTWGASRQATEESVELAQIAASLPWDPQSSPCSANLGVYLSADRPNLAGLFEELCSSHSSSHQWGVMACGPPNLVGDARCCAASHQMAFHAEEFLW